MESTVNFSIGANGLRNFSCEVEFIYDAGDYETPPDTDFNIISEIFDEDNGIECNDLISRYERFTGVDLTELVYVSFKNQ